MMDYFMSSISSKTEAGGTATNGPATNGTATIGTATNGTARNGTATNSTAPEEIWVLGSRIKELKSLESLVESLIWFTYRKGFSPIGSSQFTSDQGWGCMLRCGQMVLAEAILRLKHHSQESKLAWKWSSGTQDAKYLDTIKLFQDTKPSVYSIHQIALMGECVHDMHVGQWFGPNGIAQVLKVLTKYDSENEFRIYVAMDLYIAKDEVHKPDSQWKPTLIFLPLRLGLSEFNLNYTEGLKACFEAEQCVGIIGGRPNHAHYFIGYSGNQLLFLDPHTTQDFGSVGANMSEEEQRYDATYHTKTAGRLDFTELEPSLALCFFCYSESDFNSLWESLQERVLVGLSRGMFELLNTTPVIPIESDEAPLDWSDDDFEWL